MSTTVDLNRQRSSPLWWMLKWGSLIAGAGIIGIAVFILLTYAGHFAWVNWVSPRVELLGVQAIQFAGKDIVAEPVQIAAINPATDNNTRLRNLDVELEQAVRRGK
jgi:hypothetical protein